MSTGRLPSVDGGIQPTIVDAKGDLIVATAADTVSRLAVGSNDQVLTADSSTSTGLKWATPAAASVTFKGASAYRTTVQTISTATYTAMLLDAEEYDTDGFHSTTTNTSRFTIPAGCAGYYQCDAIVSFTADSAGMRIVAIYKNGTGVAYSNQFKGTAGTAIGPQISKVLYLAVGDYIEFFVYQDTGINRNTNAGSTDHLFQISYLGA